MKHPSAPIGIFDSGLGGLTVLKEVLRELPQESVVYFGDTARVPYGTKSKETITRFSRENTNFLLEFQIKLLIVACHTASSLALETLQSEFSLPIVGMVDPGARKAVEVSRSGRIGIIGTRSSIQSRAYEAAIRRLKPQAQVFGQACPLFVSFIEEGWTEGEVVQKVAAHYLNPLVNQKIDTLILGCTHYPILEERIREVMPKEVTLVNPAQEAALSARAKLKELNLLAVDDRAASVRYFVSDEPASFKSLGERFLGQSIPEVQKMSFEKDSLIPGKA
jgi:glutamate racemase